jgi:hypothetical protein
MPRPTATPIAAVLILACAGVVLGGCSILSLPIDALVNNLAGETRLHYTAQVEGAATPIANATLSFHALSTGGDAADPAAYETGADAIVVTGTDGKALVYIKSNPNEAEDDVLRPMTFYRVRVTAPGFEPLETSVSPYEENLGIYPKAVSLTPVAPES